MNSRRFTASASRASDGKDSTALLRCEISIWPMSAAGQSQSFGDVGSMSDVPECGHDWAIYEYAP
jgi:hypothetical protein